MSSIATVCWRRKETGGLILATDSYEIYAPRINLLGRLVPESTAVLRRSS